jgi:hypothetical protein
MSIADMVMIAIYFNGSLVIATLAIKSVLFFKFEKNWDSVGFFYFPKQVLRMTNMSKLKVWRQRQNYLSKVFLFLLLLLAVITIFHKLIF